MAVFVLDKQKDPLMPCSEKRARLLLERGRAVVHRRIPFTIRLKDSRLEESGLQPVRLKLDPGSQKTGMALVREGETRDVETGEVSRSATVLMLLELKYRGHVIRAVLRQRQGHRRVRRSRLRYRPARFNNRRRPDGWLAPSLQHRVETTMTWVRRLMRWVPVKAVVTKGKKIGTYVGRVAVRASGSFNIQTALGLVQGISYRFCTRIQRTDGYGYSFTKIALQKGEAGETLSLPGLKAAVSRAI